MSNDTNASIADSAWLDRRVAAILALLSVEETPSMQLSRQSTEANARNNGPALSSSGEGGK